MHCNRITGRTPTLEISDVSVTVSTFHHAVNTVQMPACRRETLESMEHFLNHGLAKKNSSVCMNESNIAAYVFT
jgi:hypothetical protein